MAIRALILFLLLQPAMLQAQQTPGIRFSERTHDFGEIREEDSPFLHTFTFVNGTADSVVIGDVQASCGCTVPSWTKEKLAPGDSGYVQAEYSADRPGTFSKSLQVTFNGINDPFVLQLQGKVLPAMKSPVEALPAAIGSLHLKYHSVNMGKLLTTDSPSVKEFQVYNAGMAPLRVDSAWHPPHVAVSFMPEVLDSAALGKMRIQYDAKAVGRLGFQSENITLFTNDSAEPVKQISLYTTIAEYFPPMTDAELKTAAHLTIRKPVHDFDRIQPDSSYTTTFTVINSGQSLLNIRQLEVNCSCLTAEIDKMELKPGREAVITVTFDTSNRKGNQQKSVTIYTNDPIAPAQRMTVSAYIELKD